MSQNVSQSPSNHFPPVPDFTPLIVALHEMTQTLLNLSQAGQALTQGPSEQPLDAVRQNPLPVAATLDSGLQEPPEAPMGLASGPKEAIVDMEKATACPPPISKRGRRRELRELFKAFHFDPADTIALAEASADKLRTQTFERAYANGQFHNEIRYYYVPHHIVRFEHQMLREHQPKDILSLLGAMHNDS